MIKKTIRQYLVLNAITSFAMGTIAAIYVTFLTSHGLNMFEVSMVNFVFFSTLFVCEIPTGAFADIFGRKTSFVIACLLLSAGTFIYAVSKSFWGFALAEFVSAIGKTFASGAFKAWFVDSLKHHGYNGELHRIFSRVSVIGKSMGIISALLGAYLADIRSDLPWFLMGTLELIAGIMALVWLKEEYFVKNKFSFRMGLRAMKGTVRQSIEFGIKNNAVRFLLVAGVIQLFAVQAPNMQWQPYFIEYFVENKLLGYLWVGMVLGLMTGSLLAGKLLSLVKDEKLALIICQIATGLMIAIVTLLPFPAGIAMYILHEVPRGAYEPLKDKFLQDAIPSHARATLTSFESIAPHLGGMIGLFVSGFLANRFGMQTAWVTSGLTMVFVTILVSRNRKKK